MSLANLGLKFAGKALGWLGVFTLLLISILFLGAYIGLSSSWSTLIALVGWATAFRLTSLQRSAFIALAVALLTAVGYLIHRPSNDRSWKPEVARLPQLEVESNRLSITDLRDFRWNSKETFVERWANATYDISQLAGIDLVVVPFDDADLAAHVMLSFSFEDGRRLVVSVEGRLEIGETYSLMGGAARQLELIYVFGTESDLIDLRIRHRGDRLYLFPLRLDPNFAKELLLELCQSTNQLNDQPKFYATLRNNCTTSLLRHVNRLREEPIGLSREILFPARIGQLLHRLGYLDTNLDWPEAKQRFRVDDKIGETLDLDHYSRILRAAILEH